MTPPSASLATFRFAILGCGGLGCPVVMHLLAAGARRFVLIDDDSVEEHNLHRQVVYNLADRGRAKTTAMRDWIVARARDAEVQEFCTRLAVDQDSILPDFSSVDVLIECTDQPEIKFHISDHAAQHGYRAVIGGAQGWTGHVFAYVPGQACLRCLFEGPPPAELEQSCARTGVFSSTTAVVGVFMAAAAIEVANNLATQSFFFNYDVHTLALRRLHLTRRRECVCNQWSQSHGTRLFPEHPLKSASLALTLS